MKFTTILAAATSVGLLATGSQAVCSGYNYAYFDGGPTGVYMITNTFPNCGIVRVDHLEGKNVCTVGRYKCSPPPIRVTDILVNGLWYYCRDDKNKGKCPGRPGAEAVPTSCCRNDGKRNFNEGLITLEEYQAIERRNAELDIELEAANEDRLKRAIGRNIQ